MTAERTSSWPQILAWRMRRQLLEPIGQPDVHEVVERLCGVQAQVPSAAASAVAVRQQDPPPDQVDQALREGRLMRTWAMRGTLHLLTPEGAGAYLALLAAGRTWEKPSWQKAFGVKPDEMVEFTAAVAEVLDGRTLSREELVAKVGDHLGRADFEQEMRSGWGTLLKPVAWQGVLCQGPPDGKRITFGRPDQLLPAWGGLPDADEAARQAITSYLGTYGPATMERFDAWLSRGNTRKAVLRGWFAALEDELTMVEVDGQSLYLRTADLDDVLATKPTEVVRLLPGFDQYVMGHGTNAVEIIPGDHRSEVSRQAGWISPVVVAGGRVVGVWDLSGGKVDVHLFADSDPVPADVLDAEIARVEAMRAG